MKFGRNDWVGIMAGVALGAIQFSSILENPMFNNFSQVKVTPIILFGLLAPPFLALINRAIKYSPPAFYRKIEAYINGMFMMISFGITIAIIGGVYHLIIGIPNNALLPICFFGSAGFGFIGAYFVYPELCGHQKT